MAYSKFELPHTETYPNEFFQFQELSITGHTSASVGGDLDFQYLLDGRSDHYFDINQPTRKQPKSLIISDWRSKTWDTATKMALSRIFIKALDDGFTLRRWDNTANDIFLITKDNLAYLFEASAHKRIQLCTYDSIYNMAMSQLKLTRDNLLILDDYWIDHLLHARRSTQPRQVKLSEIIKDSRSYFASQCLNDLSPPLTIAIQDVFSKKANANLEKLLLVCPHIQTITRYESLQLCGDDINKLVRNQRLQSGKISLELSDLQEIKQLKIWDWFITQKELSFLLTNLPQLKVLFLGGCQNISLIDENNLSNLEEISIDNYPYVWDDVQPKLRDQQAQLQSHDDTPKILPSLFHSHSKLARISLTGIMPTRFEIPKGLFSAQKPLYRLSSIDLNSCDISVENLTGLFESAPNLSSIILDYLNPGLSFSKKLLHLKSIEIKNCYIGMQNSLNQLLNSAPNLETLSISGSLDYLDLSKDSLKKLKIIHLTGMDITSRWPNHTMGSGVIEVLLNASPNLTHLTIDLKIVEIPPLGACEHNSTLESLVLDHTNITKEFMFALMNASTQLNSLKIMGDFKDNSDDSYEENSLPNSKNQQSLSLNVSSTMKYLAITCETISEKDIEALLKYAPTLTSFDLDSETVTQDGFNLEPFLMPKLRTINLHDSDCSKNFVISLIQAAPNITELQISGENTDLECLTIIDKHTKLKKLSVCENIPSLQGLFKTVSELEIHYNFVSNFWEQLFEAMPHVTTLSLDVCEETDIDYETDHKTTISSLQLINIRNNQLEADHLQLLKKAAPNARMIASYPLSTSKNSLLCEARTQKMEEPRAWISPFNIKPIQPSPSLEKKYLDANTSDQNASYSLNRIFYGLLDTKDFHPAFSRTEIHYLAEVNKNVCGISEAFQLSTPKELDLELESHERYILKSTPQNQRKNDCLLSIGRNREASESRWPSNIDDHEMNVFLMRINKYCNLFYANFSLYIGLSWEMLPSLSPQERMLHYRIGSDNEFEIMYSKRDSRYCIRRLSGKPSVVSIELILYVSRALLRLSPNIIEIVKIISTYSSGALDLKKSESLTGQSYIAAILAQKKGACRHRSFVFKYLMQTIYPETPVRVITNDCHSFAEVKINDAWVTCDLGGYRSNITINEAPINTSLLPGSTTLLTDSPIAELALDDVKAADTPMTSEIPEPQPDTLIENFIKDTLVYLDMPSRQLVSCESEGVTHALQFMLREEANTQKHPFFCVDSPDQLVCSSNEIYRDAHNMGLFKKGPSGNFYKFLKQAKETPEQTFLLCIDFSKFNISAIIRSNELFDEKPSIDTIEVPDNIKIIALINTGSTECYQGDDFKTRFQKITPCPLSFSQVAHKIPNILPVNCLESNDNISCINLYNAYDWERQLLGSWKMSGRQLIYSEGILQKLLHKGNLSTLVIENGPWNNKEFLRFWQNALHTHIIKHAGSDLSLPDNLKLYYREGYDWEKLIQPLLPNESGSCAILSHQDILNPGRFQKFLASYKINDGFYEHTNGLIAEAKGTSLHVTLTRALNEHEWARFLNECILHEVRLTITTLGEVLLPVGMTQFKLTSIDHKPPYVIRMEEQKHRDDSLPWDEHTQVINSTDIETTLAMLSRSHQKALVLDISEMSSADLLVRLTAKIDQESFDFRCTETLGVLLTSLKQGRAVILKGTLSEDLADALAPLLLGQNGSNILIVSNNTSLLPYLQVSRHHVDAASKRACLGLIPIDFPEETLEKETLSQLQARQRYLSIHPKGNSDDAWDGMSSLKNPVPKLERFHIKTVEQEVCEHNTARISALFGVLRIAPYVLITGRSGVGKTTFILENFSSPNNSHRVQLHQDEVAIQAWADDRTEDAQYIVLFLDEATLSQKQWSQFDGLFRTPQFIVIEGREHLLTPKHKVIFAGNPVNYGDDRILAPFFKEHGNAIVFEPLPMAVIYQKVLGPIFCDMGNRPDLPKAIEYVLTLYHYVCHISLSEILMSPRELQMIALLTIAYAKRHPISNLSDVIAFYAYAITKPLIPHQHLNEFETNFKPSTILEQRMDTISSKNFLLTESRLPLFNLLMDMLSLRELRQNSLENSAKRYGGINGITIEGPSGIGKSQLVISTLEHAGYSDTDSPFNRKKYYKMPAIMPLQQQTLLLMKAFHEGAVVIADEINTQGMKEKLLNSLLMGKDLEGRPAKQAGFMLICTQNPSTLSGRRVASTALSRRLLSVTLEAYPATEEKTILMHKGLDLKQATQASRRGKKNIRDNLSSLSLFSKPGPDGKRQRMMTEKQIVPEPSPSSAN